MVRVPSIPWFRSARCLTVCRGLGPPAIVAACAWWTLHRGAWAEAPPEPVSLVVVDAFGFEATDAAGTTDPVSFSVRRTGQAPERVTLAYAGSATPGTDYVAGPRAIDFARGESARTIVLAPIADALPEPGPPETIVVRVTGNDGAHAISLGMADADSGGTGLEECEIDVEESTLRIPTPSARIPGEGGRGVVLNANRSTEFRLYVPRRKGVAPEVIRGVVVGLPGSGGRDYYDGHDVFLEAHAFAYLSLTETPVSEGAAREEGIEFFDEDGASGAIDPAVTQPILDALAAFARALARPELAHAPLVLYGHSRGALTAELLAAHVPGRVIGFVANHWAAPIAEPSAELRAVPALFLSAEYDRNYSADGARRWEAGRAAGALWGWAIGWGQNHNYQNAQRIEALEFFDALIPLRLRFEAGVAGRDPRLGPVRLEALDEASGYLGERIHETFRNAWARSAHEQTEAPNWYRDFETPHPIALPHARFDRRERRRHPWFPDARTANLFVTHVSLGSLSVRFRSPDFTTRRGLFVAGRPIRASLELGGFPEARRVEFLANERVVGTVDRLTGRGAERRADFRYVLDDPGMFRLSARAIAADGTVRVSGDHGIEGALIATIRPNVVGGNHAPEITPIANQTVLPGASLTLPFQIADADTAPGNLRVTTVSHLGPIATDVRIEGTGARRRLVLGIAPLAEGAGEVLVFVSDGDRVATEYVGVTIPRRGSGPVITPYVQPEWEIVPAGVWTRPMTFQLRDDDAPVSTLRVAFDTPNATRRVGTRPDASDTLLGGFYDVRSLRARKPEGERATRAFRVSDGSRTARGRFDHDDGVAIGRSPPSISEVSDLDVPARTRTVTSRFRVADLETLEPALVVTASSSDATRLPPTAIALTHPGVSGIDRERLVTITAPPHAHGDVTLRLRVRDEAGLEDTTELVVHLGRARTAAASGDATGGLTRRDTVRGALLAGALLAVFGFGVWRSRGQRRSPSAYASSPPFGKGDAADTHARTASHVTPATRIVF